MSWLRQLGDTGIMVSALGLGTVKLGRDQGVKYPEGFQIPDERAASALARIIHREGWTSFSSRDVQRRGRSGLRDKKEIDPAIDLLVQAAWITTEHSDPGPKGGRRKITYHVNPLIRGAS